MPAPITITCRLAVAGHIHYSVDHDPTEEAAARERVSQRLDGILAAIKDGARGAIQACHGFEPLLVESQPRLVLISSLAPGTDQLASERAAAAAFDLAAVLPGPVENYATVIPPAAATELRRLAQKARDVALVELDNELPVGPADEETRQKSFKIAGHVVLQNADFLLAVYDDDPDRRINSGGTAEMVRRAREAGIPTFRIHPRTGIIQIEHSETEIFDDVSPAMQAAVAKCVRQELSLIPEELPHDSHNGGDADGHTTDDPEKQRRKEIARLKQYFDEQPLHERHGFWKQLVAAWTALDNAFSVPPLKSFAFEPVVKDIEAVLKVHQNEADRLAIHYTGLHRASVTLLFTFGVLSVFFAGMPAVAEMLSQGGHDPHGAHGDSAADRVSWSIVFGVAELICLSAGVWLFLLNRLGGWHERATDYRLLAERLRNAAALSVLGRATWQYAYEPLPAHYSEHNPRSGWVDRLFRALVRQAVLPVGNRRFDDAGYIAACRRHLAGVYLGSQAEYHRRNAAKLHRQHSVVEIISFTALFFTFLACIGHFFWHCPVLTLCATTFPAVIAACHGLAAHFHLQRVQARSEAMHRRLEQQRAKLEAIDDHSPSQPLALWVEEAADVMLQEADEWRVVFRLLNVPTPG